MGCDEPIRIVRRHVPFSELCAIGIFHLNPQAHPHATVSPAAAVAEAAGMTQSVPFSSGIQRGCPGTREAFDSILRLKGFSPGAPSVPPKDRAERCPCSRNWLCRLSVGIEIHRSIGADPSPVEALFQSSSVDHTLFRRAGKIRLHDQNPEP
jgi:hypothetical protein